MGLSLLQKLEFTDEPRALWYGSSILMSGCEMGTSGRYISPIRNTLWLLWNLVFLTTALSAKERFVNSVQFGSISCKYMAKKVSAAVTFILGQY